MQDPRIGNSWDHRVSSKLRMAAAIAACSGFWGWSLMSEAVRDPQGYLTGRVLFPLAAGVAAGVLLGALMTPRAKCAGWTALALLGQASALQLIKAGPVVGYQHLWPLSEMVSGSRLLALAFLSIQLIAVVFGLGMLAKRWKGSTALGMPAWRWALLALALFILSATASREPVLYLHELLTNTLIQIVGLANLVLIGASVPEDDLAALTNLLRRFWGGGQARNRTLLLVALTAVLVSGLLSCVAYQRHPHIPDEVGYIYQAKYFAAGALTMPPPPMPEAFEMQMMTITPDRWYGIFPPGWPAVLALGFMAGVPWLVNPLLTGLNIVLAYIFVVGFFDRGIARKVALLLAFSPWHLLMGMSFMSHSLVMALALSGAISVLHARRCGRIRWALAAGICIGSVSLVRPMDGLSVALALGLWMLWPAGARPWRSLVAMGIAAVLIGGIQLPYNRAVTGDPLRFPTSEYMDATHGVGTNALGFGPDRGAGWAGVDPLPGHGPIDVVINANLNLTVINVELHGWMTASLVMLVFLFLASGATRRDWGLLSASGVVIAIYSLYWFSGGPDFAARYWFLVLVPWIVLTARGCDHLGALMESSPSPGATRRVWFAVAIASAAAVLVFLPWRAADKYHHYRGMEPGIRDILQDPRLEGALLLVRGPNFPDYMSAAVYNEIGFPPDAPVLAWFGSEEMARAAIAAFPEREVRIIDGPSRTGDGFKLVEGPLRPGYFSPPP